MIVKLPYGKDHRAVDLRGFRVRPIQPRADRRRADPAEIVGAALDNPIDGKTLVRAAASCRSAVVVVPDSTRSCELRVVLPEVFARLREAGITSAATTVVVACGTHPCEEPGEIREHLGPLPESVRVVQHDARDGASLSPAGRLTDGLEVRLNRTVMEAQFLITIGAVKHHYFAGFGGGPKMIFPGVAGYEEIQVNHSLVIESPRQSPRRAAGCEPGVLAGNPVAEQIARAAALRPPDLALCLVPGVDGGIAEAFAGHWKTSWKKAVERVRAGFEINEGTFDLVVASGGGAPYDHTLIQAHKGLDAACRFLKPGGEALYVASLAGGPGSTDMAPYLADPRPKEILARLSEKWVQYGHTTLRIVEKTARNRIHLVSDLDQGVANRLGFRASPQADEVIGRWREQYEGSTIAVLTGAAVYPRSIVQSTVP